MVEDRGPTILGHEPFWKIGKLFRPPLLRGWTPTACTFVAWLSRAVQDPLCGIRTLRIAAEIVSGLVGWSRTARLWRAMLRSSATA